MPKKMSDEEYYKTLPKKQVGTAVLFLNAKHELLMVKPDYKDSWLVPGGSADEGESPLTCALRETQEEIGLTPASMQLIGVYFAPAKGLYSDSLKFLFYGGVLSESDIVGIRLQNDELVEYKFCSLEDALPLLSGSLKASIPMSLEALREGKIAYKEAL